MRFLRPDGSHDHRPCRNIKASGVNGSVTLGDGLRQRGRYPWDRSHPVGSRGEEPIGGLVDETPS